MCAVHCLSELAVGNTDSYECPSQAVRLWHWRSVVAVGETGLKCVDPQEVKVVQIRFDVVVDATDSNCSLVHRVSSEHSLSDVADAVLVMYWLVLQTACGVHSLSDVKVGVTT